jgi:hypothetical protein
VGLHPRGSGGCPLSIELAYATCGNANYVDENRDVDGQRSWHFRSDSAGPLRAPSGVDVHRGRSRHPVSRDEPVPQCLQLSAKP